MVHSSSEIDASEFAAITTRLYRLGTVGTGFHHFVPVIFDEMHLSVCNVCVHAVLLDFCFRPKQYVSLWAGELCWVCLCALCMKTAWMGNGDMLVSDVVLCAQRSSPSCTLTCMGICVSLCLSVCVCIANDMRVSLSSIEWPQVIEAQRYLLLLCNTALPYHPSQLRRVSLSDGCRWQQSERGGG